MAHYPRTLGKVLLILVLAAGGMAATARWGAAQPSIRQGAFVVAQDGSRWVVGNGQRHRVDWTFDDTNVIPALPEGVAVATVCEAAAALAAAAASTACDVPTRDPAATAPDPGPALAPASDVLIDVVLDVRGLVGSGAPSETFTISTPTRVEMCWDLRGPTVSGTAYANLFLEGPSPSGMRRDFPHVVLSAQSRDGCHQTSNRLQPATYSVRAAANYEQVRMIVRAI
jgi:hypothetical protein